MPYPLYDIQQVKELDDNAHTYEIGSDFVAEPSSPVEFRPKPVVRRLLLQVRHGKEIAATFIIRSNSDNCDTEVLYPSYMNSLLCSV